MAYTNEDLLSALEKVGSIEFTEAEAEAMADLFAQEDDVSGFFFRPNPGGDGTTEHFFTVEISEGRAGMFHLGYTATDDLWK